MKASLRVISSTAKILSSNDRFDLTINKSGLLHIYVPFLLMYLSVKQIWHSSAILTRLNELRRAERDATTKINHTVSVVINTPYLTIMKGSVLSLYD